jgi:hypothetical protein
VLTQKQILPQLKANIDKNPTLVSVLHPFEEELKKNWPYAPGKNAPKDIKTEEKSDDAVHKSFLNMAIQKGAALGQQALHELTHTEVMRDASGNPVYEKSWLARHADETPFGSHLGEWIDKK